MSREVYIARGVTELGPLTKSEVRELLREGFLLPTDLYWEVGMTEWAELREFDSAPASVTKGDARVKSARREVSSAGKSTAARASDLTRKLRSFAGRGHKDLSGVASRLLDSFAPQIQKLVSHQLVRQSVACAQKAARDDDFMRGFFGVIYDCLPRPVRRFVPEKPFVRYCMERRLEMLGIDTPRTDSQEADLDTARPQEI